MIDKKNEKWAANPFCLHKGLAAGTRHTRRGAAICPGRGTPQKTKTFIAKASRALCFVFGPFPSPSPSLLQDSSRGVWEWSSWFVCFFFWVSLS